MGHNKFTWCVQNEQSRGSRSGLQEQFGKSCQRLVAQVRPFVAVVPEPDNPCKIMTEPALDTRKYI